MNISKAKTQISVEEIGQLLKPISLRALCENPLVSIITANYNYARFIGEAIESVLKQTYINWEMIICDDGSTDNSCEVAEQYVRRDSRIRLFKKQTGGQVSATNAAYSECEGQIVCFLDSDDRFLPEKLETVVQAFKSHPDCGFAGHRVVRINAEGRRYGAVSPASGPPSGWYGPWMVRFGAIPRGLAFGPAICLRREISDLIYPVSEGFVTGPDQAVTALAPLMTPLIGIRAPLVEYRYHGGNMMNSPKLTEESLHSAKRKRSLLLAAGKLHFKVSREYLANIDPVLAEALLPMDKRPGALHATYMEAREQTWWGALAPYKEMVADEGFRTNSFPGRWFWRLSILLPRPVLYRVLAFDRFKAWFWRAVEARRRIFGNSESVGLSH